MKAIVSTLFAATMAFATSAHAENAVAHLPRGMALLLMDQGKSCNGGPEAILLDKQGKRLDGTCSVEIGRDGVQVTFPGYGKPLFFSKDQFETLPG
jgi:hypothetical protein